MMNKNEEVLYSLSEEPASEKKPSRKRLGWRIFRLSIFLIVFLLIASALFANQIKVSDESQGDSWMNGFSFLGGIKNIAESAHRKLKGEDRDRINILLLGMGGKNHDGGYLTDTIMLTSLRPSNGQGSMISVPRDMAIPMEGYGWRKVNHVNAYAEKEEPGSGGLATSQAIADVLDEAVDYFVLIDFQGFINVIDKMGGIDVNVENDLDDYRYPVLGREDDPSYYARYEHLHVEKGLQHMDGSMALKFARSRHAMGAEGSDFARARRQQLIIEAAKDKALSAGVLLNPKTLASIISELDDHFSTNLSLWEMMRLWELFKDTGRDDIANYVLDNGPNGLLENATGQDGAYLLQPRSGDFAEIQYFVENAVSGQAVKDKEEEAEIAAEAPTVEVRNGTWINGLASRQAQDLEKQGFEILRIGNSGRQNLQASVIYDLSYGAKPKSLARLALKARASISNELPDWLATDIGQDNASESEPLKADFILVLGQDADLSSSGKRNPENNDNDSNNSYGSKR